MCIAAYLAIGGGFGVSLTTAAHLRTALLWLCWSVLVLFAARVVMRLTMTSTLLANLNSVFKPLLRTSFVAAIRARAS
jgi:hypothetical protein